MSYEEIKEVIDLIPNEKQIFISGHLNPDMDSIGSSLALARYLNSLGKHANVLLDKSNFKILDWFNDYTYVIDEPDILKKEEYVFILLDANEKKDWEDMKNILIMLVKLFKLITTKIMMVVPIILLLRVK